MGENVRSRQRGRACGSTYFPVLVLRLKKRAFLRDAGITLKSGKVDSVKRHKQLALHSELVISITMVLETLVVLPFTMRYSTKLPNYIDLASTKGTSTCPRSNGRCRN